MLANFLFTSLYLCAAGLLALMAWTGWFNFPSIILWVAAGICLIVGLWRLFHMSRG